MNDTSNPPIYHTMPLPSSLTLEAVEALHEALLSHLDETSMRVVTLDAAATEFLATAGLQLLISLDQTLERSAGKLIITNIQENVMTAITLLGCRTFLEKWNQSDAH